MNLLKRKKFKEHKHNRICYLECNAPGLQFHTHSGILNVLKKPYDNDGNFRHLIWPLVAQTKCAYNFSLLWRNENKAACHSMLLNELVIITNSAVSRWA
jgi:hypothetical protein